MSPTLQVDSLSAEPPGKPSNLFKTNPYFKKENDKNTYVDMICIWNKSNLTLHSFVRGAHI